MDWVAEVHPLLLLPWKAEPLGRNVHRYVLLHIVTSQWANGDRYFPLEPQILPRKSHKGKHTLEEISLDGGERGECGEILRALDPKEVG